MLSHAAIFAHGAVHRARPPCHDARSCASSSPPTVRLGLHVPDGRRRRRSPRAGAPAAPHDELDVCPLCGRRPGLRRDPARRARRAAAAGDVRGPWASPSPRRWSSAGTTAYVETAQAVGLPWSRRDLRDPTRTSSAGAGELVAVAREAGARRIVVGLGGSAHERRGSGAWSPPGRWPRRAGDVLDGGGGALADVTPHDLAGLRALRADCGEVELVVARDVDVPLLGLHGASAGFAAQKGATPEQAQELERALGHFAHAAVAALGDAERPDLLAGAAPTAGASALPRRPGAGAAGGLGFGLALLGARLVPGSVVVADAVGLDALIADQRRRRHRRGAVRLAVAARQGGRRGGGAGARRTRCRPWSSPARCSSAAASWRPPGSPPPTRSARPPAEVAAALAGPGRRPRPARRPRWRGPGHVQPDDVRRIAPLDGNTSGPDRDSGAATTVLSSEHPGETHERDRPRPPPRRTACLLTDFAAGKVRSLLEQEGRDDLRLRVAVQPGGCSGLIYQLYFDERVLDGDVVKDYDGVEVVVDRMSVPYLEGATIDFADTIEKQGFTIDNPNAGSACACGGSFS